MVPAYRVWLLAIFILPLASDAAIGLMEVLTVGPPVSPGVVLRGLLTAAGLAVVVWHARALPPMVAAWPVLALAAAVPSLAVGAVGGGALFYDIAALVKACFLPIMTALLVAIMRLERMRPDSVLKAIEICAYLYAACLIVPGWLGLEARTYGDYAFGAKGLLQAGNDAGVALGIALMAAGYRLVFVRFSLVRLALLAFGAYACMQLGSRASLIFLLGFALTILVGAVVLRDAFAARVRLGNGGRMPRVAKLGLGLGLAALVAGAMGYGLTRQLDYGFQQEKLLDLARGQVTRDTLMAAGLQHVTERPALLNVTGEGADLYERGVARHWAGRERRMTEIDWLDAYGGYGLPFALLSHLFVILAICAAARGVLRGRDGLSFILGAGLTLYLAHSVLAGHALYGPTPATIAAGYAAILFHLQRGRRPSIPAAPRRAVRRATS